MLLGLHLTLQTEVKIEVRYYACCSNSTPAPKGLTSPVSERAATNTTLVISTFLQRAISPKDNSVLQELETKDAHSPSSFQGAA
ncbi:hypothetical protein LEMLEM_LOCUS18240 [Lemmus lemmus]